MKYLEITLILIDIWDKWKRGNSSQGVKRNLKELVEGGISNILDELIVVITVNDLGIGLVWDNPTGPDQTIFGLTVEILFKLN